MRQVWAAGRDGSSPLLLYRLSDVRGYVRWCVLFRLSKPSKRTSGEYPHMEMGPLQRFPYILSCFLGKGSLSRSPCFRVPTVYRKRKRTLCPHIVTRPRSPPYIVYNDTPVSSRGEFLQLFLHLGERCVRNTCEKFRFCSEQNLGRVKNTCLESCRSRTDRGRGFPRPTIPLIRTPDVSKGAVPG